MTTYKGKDGIVRIGAVVVGEVRSFEIVETANEVDTSVMGSDWTGVDSTQRSWKGSMTMFWDQGDPGQAAIVVGAKVALEFYPRGVTSTYRMYSGNALVTSVSRPQAHDGLVESTVEFTGDEALTTGVAP